MKAVAAIAAAALCAWWADAHATNKCIDAQGRITFQDAPCPSSAKSSERLNVKPTNTANPEPPRYGRGVAGATPADTIALKCESDWPNDFRMQSYCQRRQIEGLRSLDRTLDASASETATIRLQCAKEWPNDYSMRAYCERKQVEGLRELGR